MNPQLRIRLRRVVYISTLVCIIIFLIIQGIEPWKVALGYWPVMLGVMVLSPLFIMVQTIAFRYCVPPDVSVPNLPRLIRIWAVASITSFIAPLVAGLAVRVTLLKQEGMDIKTSSIATVLQTLINVDYAWVTGSILLILYPWPDFLALGYISVSTWLLFKISFIFLPNYQFLIPKYLMILNEKFPKIPWRAQPWLWGQIAVMGLNYWLAFRLGGAPLSWHFSLLLASITILASLAIFIPNGLGVLDGLWVWIASQQGLSLAEGIALALTIRLGFILGAICILLTSILLANRSSNASISGH
jgi:hypothetical protein